MSINWDIVLSVVTVIIAGFAITQTQKQIKISNKQHLFDKRVENYLIAKGLLSLYRKNQPFSVRLQQDAFLNSVNLEFVALTNHPFLYGIMPAIFRPSDMEYEREFLSKMGMLEDVSAKIKLLFSDKSASYLGDFIFIYQQLIYSLYLYEMCIYPVLKGENPFKQTLEEVLEGTGEPTHRRSLQKSIEDIKQAYDKLVEYDVEKNIEKQIRL